MMGRRRGAGLLLHVTSLPGKLGIGDMGPEAFRFVDQLAKAKQSIWQILPLGPTGYGDSPYQCYSAFAGNALLISIEKLIEEGLLPKSVLKDARLFPPDRVEFESVTPWRMKRLREAFEADPSHDGGFTEFCEKEAAWLDDFALFMAFHDKWPDRSWTSWPEELRARRKPALRAAQKEFERDIQFHRWIQHRFAQQWDAVKKYAGERHISILGDVPIFVSHESADVWSNQSLFQLNSLGQPTKVAGVPPDYFSETGQRWGNPLYRWDKMEANGFRWWVDRLVGSLKFVDLIRLDHFRGFEAYWEIPAEAPTAATGRWVPGPREKLFATLQATVGQLPIVAEDLGVITPPVEKLRDDFGFPGMRVLQFAFSGNNASHLPHNYVQNCVSYTGTHDNDTTAGWFHAEPGKTTTQTAKEVAAERKLVRRYLDVTGEEIHWDMIRAIWRSVTNTAIAPVQDILGLGSEARMNLPGTASGNWRWRLKPGQLRVDALARLADFTELYDRAPAPQEVAVVPAVKPRKRS